MFAPGNFEWLLWISEAFLGGKVIGRLRCQRYAGFKWLANSWWLSFLTLWSRKLSVIWNHREWVEYLFSWESELPLCRFQFNCTSVPWILQVQPLKPLPGWKWVGCCLISFLEHPRWTQFWIVNDNSRKLCEIYVHEHTNPFVFILVQALLVLPPCLIISFTVSVSGIHFHQRITWSEVE